MALSTNKEGNVVTKLASATELPRMVKVRQKLDHSHIEPEEIPALVQRELEPMRSRIRAGMRVAITCGSRGVANIAIITRAIVDFVKSCGESPLCSRPWAATGEPPRRASWRSSAAMG